MASRYAIFHPLAYLVKLNIEMSMAHLIKKIAMDNSRNSDQFIILNAHNSAFKCCTQDSDSLPPTRQTMSVLKSLFDREAPSPPLAKNGFLKTEEFRMQNGPMTDLEMQQPSQRIEQDIYDGSSYISNNDSIAWVDVDWRGADEGDQEISSVRNVHASLTANDEAHLIRPAPAVLRPL